MQPLPVPSRILELVAGPCASAVSLIWKGHRLAEYLTAPDFRRHVWHACLASPYATFSVERECADFLYGRMCAMRAKDLIVQAYGTRPPGLLGVMRRLGPEPRPLEIYQLLIAAMEKGGAGAQQLMHLEDPTDAWIETIAALPRTISKRTIAALTRCKQLDPEDLALLVWTAERLQPGSCGSCNTSLLTSNDPISALSAMLMARPFPAPPWQGTPMLKPLTSTADLIRVATDFNNCLQPQHGHANIFRVINGTKYFYRWLGAETAVIELVSLAGVGWYVKEVRGPNNCSISLQTKNAVARAFSEADNICAARLKVRADIYPCGKFWEEIIGGMR